MAVITPPSITPVPTPVPQRNDRTTFSSRVDAFVTWLITAVTEFGAVADNVALNATDAATSATTASTQAGNAITSATNANNSAVAAAGYASTAAGFTSTSTTSFTIGVGSKVFTTQSSKQYTTGAWVTVSDVTPTNYMFGQVTAYSGTSLTVNVTSTGGTGTFASWNISLAGIAGPAGGVSSLNGQTGALVNFADLNTAQVFTNKTAESLILNNGYTEEVYVITDGASVDLNPANGSIQTWVLGANRTATASSFSAGQSLILGVDDGSTYSLTWPSVTWTKVGGSGTVPVLTATGKTWVVLWKVGSTLYGSLLGSA